MKRTRRTLRDIGDDLLALEALLEDVGGDVTEADAEAAIDQWLAEIGTDLNKKLDGYVTLITEAEAHQRARQHEAERLLKLSDLDGSVAERLRARLLYFMTDFAGKSEIQTDHYRIRAVQNGGSLPVQLTGTVPDEYHRTYTVTQQRVDTDRIRRELEEGVELPFAKLGERGRHINIK